MPIYAYACSACGLQRDVLQKLSDAPLSVCPECGKETFAKQLTAAGFMLKGSGYYVTDFKNNGPKPHPEKADAAVESSAKPTEKPTVTKPGSEVTPVPTPVAGAASPPVTSGTV